MGERCYLHCGVRPDHAERLEAIVEGVLQPAHNDCGLFKVLICEEFSDGEVLEMAAREGLVFYGYSTPGGDYPASQFSSNGDGELYCVPGLWRDGSGYEPVIVVSQTGGIVPSEIANVRTCLAVYRQVRAMAFPEEEESYDFGDMLEARLDCIDNDAIIDEMGLNDPEVMGMLLDYIRIKRRKADEGNVSEQS